MDGTKARTGGEEAPSSCRTAPLKPKPGLNGTPAKIPFPRQTAYFVAGVEFVCGSLVAVGFLSSPSSAALLIDMTVATLTNAVSTLPKGLSPLSWLDDFLYLPEVLYVLFFMMLISFGPGKFSVDYWLAGKLRR